MSATYIHTMKVKSKGSLGDIHLESLESPNLGTLTLSLVVSPKFPLILEYTFCIKDSGHQRQDNSQLNNDKTIYNYFPVYM